MDQIKSTTCCVYFLYKKKLKYWARRIYQVISWGKKILLLFTSYLVRGLSSGRFYYLGFGNLVRPVDWWLVAVPWEPAVWACTLRWLWRRLPPADSMKTMLWWGRQRGVILGAGGAGNPSSKSVPPFLWAIQIRELGAGELAWSSGFSVETLIAALNRTRKPVAATLCIWKIVQHFMVAITLSIKWKS